MPPLARFLGASWQEKTRAIAPNILVPSELAIADNPAAVDGTTLAFRSPMDIDLELISQRVLKLAEIALLDHLDAIERSQANGLTQVFEPGGFTNNVVRPLPLGGWTPGSGTAPGYDRQ